MPLLTTKTPTARFPNGISWILRNPVAIMASEKIMTVLVYSSIDTLPSRDIDIISYQNQENLFFSIEWFRCLSRYGLPNKTLIRIYVVEKDGDQNQKCFLFCSYDPKKRLIFSLSNFYTMEFSPIFSSSECNKASLLSELAIYMARERPAWRGIHFRLLIEDKEDTRFLCTNFNTAGFLLNKYFQHENFYVKIDGIGFDDYYSLRPSRVRNTIKRKRKKLERMHRFSVSFFSSYDDRAVDDYMSIYALSWKNREEYPHFIRELCRLSAQLGVLRMGVLYIEDKPVASQLWLLSGRKAIIYKLAYDEAFKEFSVGSILTKEMVEFVLQNDEVAEIDYGIGSEPYKKEWMNENRKLIGIEAFNRKTVWGNIMALRLGISNFMKMHRA